MSRWGRLHCEEQSYRDHSSTQEGLNHVLLLRKLCPSFGAEFFNKLLTRDTSSVKILIKLTPGTFLGGRASLRLALEMDL